MHNKSWIVDNRLAIVGGRNLGNEYFGASDETNFVDLDFALVGPIVREASNSFDRYWNAAAAYPMIQLSPEAVTEENLARLREQFQRDAVEAQASRFASELKGDDAVLRLTSGSWPMNWSSRYRFVADDPLKVQGKDGGLNGSEVLAFLTPILRSASYGGDHHFALLRAREGRCGGAREAGPGGHFSAGPDELARSQ